MREYIDYIRVLLKEGDREMIQKRMKEAGIHNMSAYIRKMAIDGYVVRLDLSDLNDIARLLRINSNNLNQYAKQANTNGKVYFADIQELKRQHDEMCHLLKLIY